MQIRKIQKSWWFIQSAIAPQDEMLALRSEQEVQAYLGDMEWRCKREIPSHIAGEFRLQTRYFWQDGRLFRFTNIDYLVKGDYVSPLGWTPCICVAYYILLNEVQ